MASQALKLLLIISQIILSRRFVCGFPPRIITGEFATTRSHYDITNEGIQLAIYRFLVNNDYIASTGFDPINDYFGSDKDGYEAFLSMINTVVRANNDLQRLKNLEAKYSVNGEQIQQAHDFIVRTRKEMRELSQGIHTRTEQRRQLLLEKTGQCLYVIQSFYSSTNWVEMKGNDPYLDFGIPNKTLMAVASSEDATCQNCGRSAPFAITSCKSSLLVRDQLTSGYLSEQDIKKPVIKKYIGSDKGKCSHGGDKDLKSKTVKAYGGINKESLDPAESPRSDLHVAAATAAKEATSNFLTGEGGVLADMGKATFMWVYSLQVRSSNKSLSFIIDVSGSMSDDIAAVKEKCIDMVTSIQNTENEPDNYVLVVFNDPVSLTKSWVTENYKEMLSFLNKLSAFGGGDCPEYAMSGVLKGVELSNHGTDLLVFTDADAKDCSRQNEVEIAAQAKNITVTFILTGDCGGSPCIRRKRSITSVTMRNQVDILDQEKSRAVLRHKRAISSVYKSISDSTGGKVHETTRDKITVVIDKIIEETFPSSKVILQMFSQPSSSANKMPVFVDEDVKLLKVEISGTSITNEVDIKDPAGATKTYDSTTSSKLSSTNKVIISIQQPVNGQWTLVRNTPRDWEVNVTAEASMDINFLLIETDDKGFSFETKGNPVAGGKYALFLTVHNVMSNISSTTVAFVGENGSEQTSFPSNLTNTSTTTFARIEFVMPSTTFRVQLQGRDKNDNAFIRSSWKLVVPVTVNLQLHQVLGKLHTDEPHNLSFTLMNSGASNETFEVTFTDDKNYYKSVVNNKTYFITSGESLKDSFQITGLNDSEIVEYTISVFKSGSSTVLQSLSNRIVLSKSLFYETNRGTCCSPTVYVNAADEDNYDARCHLHLGDPYTIILPEAPSTTTTSTNEPTTTAQSTTTTEPSTTTSTTKPTTTTTQPTTTTTQPTTTTTQPTTTTTQPTTTTTQPTTTTTQPTTTTTQPTTTTTQPTTTTTQPTTTTTQPRTTTIQPTTTTTQPTTTTTQPTTTTTQHTTTATQPTTTTIQPTTTTTQPTTTTTQPTTTTTQPTTTTTQPTTTTTQPTATTTPRTTTITQPSITAVTPTKTNEKSESSLAFRKTNFVAGMSAGSAVLLVVVVLVLIIAMKKARTTKPQMKFHRMNRDQNYQINNSSKWMDQVLDLPRHYRLKRPSTTYAYDNGSYL